MKETLVKRLLAAVLALALCIGVAAVSSAVEGGAVATREIFVDTEDVVNGNFKGVGINHWTSLYMLGMNDAYQTVNEKRNNITKPAYVRMLFMPDWLVDTTLTSEQQQWEWENGIYHFDDPEVQNFFQKVKMYKESGTEVLVNLGGRVDFDILEWFAIKDATASENGTRSAPANLDAYAKFAYAVVEYAWNNGYDNVVQLSWYNEVNGGNFEAFWDKRHYWCQMIKKAHYEFKSHTYTGNPESIHYGKNARDEIKICGVDLLGYINSPDISSWFDYLAENLVDENGNPIYDYVNSHHYAGWRSNKDFENLVNEMTDKYSNVWTNEIGGHLTGPTGKHTQSENYFSNYSFSELPKILQVSNAGYGGAAVWMVSADTTPSPMTTTFYASTSGMWDFPSRGMDYVVELYGMRSLFMRYIPKDSKVYSSRVNSDDIICAVYGKEDNGNITDMSVVLELEENPSQRELTVNLGREMAGRTFERHVYTYPEKDNAGFVWLDELYEDGDLMPVTDKVITADQNGNIVDILPTNAQCEIVYTTMAEQVQIVTDKNYVEISNNETVDFDVTAIYGTDDDNDLANVTWEIYGKSRSDVNGGYNMTTENCGTIDQNGVYNSSGTSAGDTVSIKVFSNYDPTAYTIIIVEIV